MTSKEKRKLNKNRRQRARKTGKHLNLHHVIPQSREGEDSTANIAIVDMYKHRSYHTIFQNKKPDEIINYLVDYFWNGQEEWLYKAMLQRHYSIKES